MDLMSGLNLDKSVTDFKKSMDSSMKNVRTNNLTPADPTSQKMKEGVALKTSKDTGATGVISNHKSTVVEQLDGILGALSGGLLNVKSFTKAVKVGPDGVVFDTDSLFAAAGSASGMRISNGSGAGDIIAQGLNEEFEHLTGLNLNILLSPDGDSVRINKNWRGKAGAETLKLVSKFTNETDFVDASVKAAVLNSVFKAAVKFGLADNLGKLYGMYPKGMEAYQRDVVFEALREMIKRGDVKSIDKVLDLLDSEGKNVILSKYPNFVEDLLKNFKFDDDVYPEDYPEMLTMVQRVLATVAGPTWYLKGTSFGNVLNLAYVNRISKDMKTLLSTWDEVVPLLCTSGMFREESAVKQLKRQFKHVPEYDF